MTTLKTLLAGTALATMAALPAAALTIDSAADLNLSLDTTMMAPQVGSGSNTDPAAEPGAQRDGGLIAQSSAPTEGVAVENKPAEGADRSATLGSNTTDGGDTVAITADGSPDVTFASDEVMSSDGQLIGIVTQAFPDENGKQKLVVSLDDEVHSEGVREISFIIDGNAQSDGMITLGMSKAQFEEALGELRNENERGRG